MKIQEFFSEKFFAEKFSSEYSAKFFNLFRDRNGENFPQSFVEVAVQNFTAGVGSLAKKAKEVEEDARRRFCDYPSA